MEALKTARAALRSVAAIVAAIFIAAALFIEGTATVAGKVLPFLISAISARFSA
jgi:hypothetical protein